jgi:hypothetical protein|tara:strand:- start:2401 stop:2760 length:360 start_codon:yes stop_codon:yes gene_type:complete
MSNRTVGKYALGICDRSGLTFKLKDLYPQIVDGKDSGLRVSRSMLDEDQPQNFLGEFPINDPQSLPFTRTDTNVVEQRKIAWNWNPVGDNNGLSALYGFSTQTSTQAAGGVGTVTVSIS